MGYIFGKKIKELRKTKNLTIEELARYTKTSKGYISDIENTNRQPPSDKIICKLAKALEIDKKSLLRLAHIDKIPNDIKRELHLSQIITPPDLLKKNDVDISTLLLESNYRKRKRSLKLSNNYIPIINTIEQGYPVGFENLEELMHNASSFIQFTLPGVIAKFAMYVSDTAMEKKQGTSFNQKNIVFFSDREKIQENDFVFVIYQENSQNVSIFRKLHGYGRSKIQLTALHPRYRKEIILSRKICKNVCKAIGHLELL